MTKTILLAAASTVALLGCASTEEKMTAVPPHTDSRNPWVYVLSDGAPRCADRKLAIVVEPDVLTFSNPGSANAFPIIWHMKTQGYRFPENPTLPNPAPLKGSKPGQINQCKSGGANNNMQCWNDFSEKGVWKYDIKGIVADDGCNPPDRDPIINND